MEEDQPQLHQHSLNHEPDGNNNKILDSDIRMKQLCLAQCIKYQVSQTATFRFSMY